MTKLAERTKVAFTTAQRAIERLEAAGMVRPATDAKRNRVYVAKAILDILEEPTRVGTRPSRSPHQEGRGRGQ